MKICVNMPVDWPQAGPFLQAAELAKIAVAAEQAGFHALSVTDHPCPTGEWLDAGGHYAQDPFVILGLLAAATRTIRLQTGIIVLPYRNPFLTARAIATLDVVSGGRTLLGFGGGYLEGEYRALGVDFERRGLLMDEYLTAMKLAWTEDEFSFEGSGYRAVGNRIRPHPLQRPYPPIYIGGTSRRAARRAAEAGDGWNPFTTDSSATPDSDGGKGPEAEGALAETIAHLDAVCDRIGRTRRPEILVSGFARIGKEWHSDYLLAKLDRYAALGVCAVRIDLDSETPAEWCEKAERFGKEIIAQIA
jgi:probable F420-dependent oxidoreductase